MKSRSKILFAALAAVIGLTAAAPSFAHGRDDDWRGRGHAYGHWKHKHDYRPARVYVQPAPVYVQPAPVYVQPAPVYVQPAPVYYPRNAQVIVNLPPAVFNF